MRRSERKSERRAEAIDIVDCATISVKSCWHASGKDHAAEAIYGVRLTRAREQLFISNGLPVRNIDVRGGILILCLC